MKMYARGYLNRDVQKSPMQYLDCFVTLENEDLGSVAAVTWPFALCDWHNFMLILCDSGLDLLSC